MERGSFIFLADTPTFILNHAHFIAASSALVSFMWGCLFGDRRYRALLPLHVGQHWAILVGLLPNQHAESERGFLVELKHGNHLYHILLDLKILVTPLYVAYLPYQIV